MQRAWPVLSYFADRATLPKTCEDCPRREASPCSEVAQNLLIEFIVPFEVGHHDPVLLEAAVGRPCHDLASTRLVLDGLRDEGRVVRPMGCLRPAGGPCTTPRVNDLVLRAPRVLLHLHLHGQHLLPVLLEPVLRVGRVPLRRLIPDDGGPVLPHNACGNLADAHLRSRLFHSRYE